MTFELTPGEIVAVGGAVVGVVTWLVRLEGKLRVHDVAFAVNDKSHETFTERNDQDHKEIKDGLHHLTGRIDLLLSKNGIPTAKVS
jgi:hypothetical protein